MTAGEAWSGKTEQSVIPVVTVVETGEDAITLSSRLLTTTDRMGDAVIGLSSRSVNGVIDAISSGLRSLGLPHAHVVIAPSIPTRRGVPTVRWMGEDGYDVYTETMMTLGAPTTMGSAPAYAALAAWEDEGSSRGSFRERSDWARDSRVVCVDIRMTSIVIGVVDCGRIVDGMARPDDDWIAGSCSLQGMLRTSRDYWMFCLRQLVENVTVTTSPDLIVITVDGNGSETHLPGEPMGVPVRLVFAGDRTALISRGATLSEYQGMFGGDPRFLRSVELDTTDIENTDWSMNA